MNVASLELCKELYELSGWADTDFIHSETYHRERLDRYKVVFLPNTPSVYEENGQTFAEVRRHATPAYDLGFMLRRLPQLLDNGQYLLMECGVVYAFGYAEYGELRQFSATADTPEDAACKLAIELFKQGVLK